MPTRENAETTGSAAAGDLYKVLGVSRSAKPDEIRKVFRKLARKYHPDVNPGDKAAEERFKEISRAHEVLSDEKARALYDEFGADSLQPGFDAERARQYRDWQESARQGGGFGGFGRSAGGRRGRMSAGDAEGFGGFEDLFGGIFSRGPIPERGADVEVPVAIELLEAVRGTTRTIALRRPEPCPQCGGTGAVGKGAVCPRCRGAGEIEQSVKLNVKIPPGVESGSRVRVAGKGGAGSNGASAGDLFIVVEVRPHALLAREGSDLTLDVPVKVAEAVRGASITVPTPDGDVTLRIPAGTQSGRRLRLRGKGVPHLHGSGRGDLYVRVLVHVPESSDGLDAALQALDAAQPGDPRKDLRL